MISAALLLAAVSAGPVRMVFKGPRDWVLTDAAGQIARRITTLADLQPLEMAISPDGATLVFTARSPGSEVRLYKSDGNGATRLTDHDGYFTAPVFSPSGREVVFAHHPGDQSGPVGMHGAGQNAQLWQVGIDGSQLRQLTDSPGCKGASH